ncbi:MAG: DUF2017 family protein [Leucobacter sp.]
MRLLPRSGGGLRLRLDADESALLNQLVGQLTTLLQSHSGTVLDADPLFASLEVGGSDEPPLDPALARLFPDAYESGDDASDFRRVTEQGLLNRKLQDALSVTASLGVESPDDPPGEVEVEIAGETIPVWVRTLTALRLAIAARVGMERESDHADLIDSDDTRGTMLVYDWLAAILDSILRMAPHRDDEQQDPDQDPQEDPS